MAAPVPLRSDYDPARLRGLARESRDPDQTRRLLALASIYDGGLRSEAAVGGVGLQTVRDWVLRFNQDGPAGLLNANAPGPRPLLDEVQRTRLLQVVEDGRSPRSTAWCAGG
jgi:transposase